MERVSSYYEEHAVDEILKLRKAAKELEDLPIMDYEAALKESTTEMDHILYSSENSTDLDNLKPVTLTQKLIKRDYLARKCFKLFYDFVDNHTLPILKTSRKDVLNTLV